MSRTFAAQMNIFEAEAALFLKSCREIAREICKAHDGTVTADEVRIEFRRKHPEVQWNNAAGQIFRHRDFEMTGEFRKSAIRKRKGGRILVWRLRQPTYNETP